ncbi:MAG: anti-sigma factor [Pseudomonadota bacterium]
MPDAAPSPEELDTLAGELALGVLDGEELVRALRLQLADRDFRVAVLAWQERLSPLLAEIPEAPVRVGTWQGLEARLDDRAPVRLKRQVQVWRAGALAAAAVAAVLAFVLILQPLRAPVPAPPRIEIAQLVSKSGTPLLVAQYDGAAGMLRVRAAQLPSDARAPELWVIPKGGVPHSLGLISVTGNSDIAADPARRALLIPGSVLAVTLEPVTGAPHSAPTGEILGAAPLTTL